MKPIRIYLLLLMYNSAFCQWSSSSSINTPVAVVSKSQGNAHTVTDTKNGAIIAWDDNRNSASNSTDIYAQRIKSNGYEKWNTNGIAVCSNNFTQKSVSIIDAGAGSAIITWEDNRAGNYDIYAQKIDSSGNILWAIDGVGICTKSTNQKNPKIISDNAGGGIIVWEDSVNFYWDVYAQRISSSGITIWTTGGVGICTAPNAQINPKIDIDGLGGAIITWQDKRNNVDYDVYTQRINSTGAVLWNTNGLLVCNSMNSQTNARIEPDGSNGALIGWVDKRNGTDYDIYAQHINSTGSVQWATNGVAVCTAVGNQSAFDMKYLGSTGVLLAWKDGRTNTNSIYSQLVSLTGIIQLPTDGILISNSIKAINPNVVSDGTGGAIIAWQDSTGISWNIKSQKINSAGTLQWPSGGVYVSNATDDQVNVSQVTDGNGGAIFVWEDYRSGSDYDLYAHHLYFDGMSAVGINELSKSNELQSLCYPNPITTNSRIKLANNLSNKDWEVNIYDAYGHLVQFQKFKNNDVCSLNKDDYPVGIYFYFINLGGESGSSKGTFISVK
ncbi:MAG: T9SS type A sorting domain-containing protein [Burkholderiales bacterium]|nr:T9SS type A sorting domain-containing protein [Bacteroidia bacterium]